MTASSSAKHFFKGSLTHAFYSWLHFRAFIAKARWQDEAKRFANQPQPLNAWLNEQPIPATWPLSLPLIIAMLLGVSGMVGTISYAGDKPVNLWVVMGIFCALPLAMVIISTLSILIPRKTNQQRSVHILSGIFNKLILSSGAAPDKNQMKKALAQPSQSHMYWLLWQSQRMALAFQLGAIAAFIMVLLFNDTAFGWSSTIIKDAQTVQKFFSGFCLPWQSIIAAPSLEMVEQSQFFYRAEPTLKPSPSIAGEWWPHLFAGLIVYGLLPRYLLSAWLKHRCKKTLASEINNSIALKKFFNGINQIASKDPKKLVSKHLNEQGSVNQNNSNLSDPNPSKPEHDLTFNLKTNDALLCWQQSFSELESKKILGIESWQSDKAWLQQTLFMRGEPVYVAVSIQQTPTAELSDTLALIEQPKILIILLSENQQARQTQIKSWQYFAQEHSLECHIANHLSLEPES